MKNITILTSAFNNILAEMPEKIGVNALSHVNGALGTSCGLVRQENQDRAVLVRGSFFHPPHSSFILAAISDGMGGMNSGAECARLTLSVLINHVLLSKSSVLAERLEEAIHAANSQVYQQFNEKGGATLSAVLIIKDEPEAVLGNVGDSRIYSFQANPSFLFRKLTVDDTIEAQVAKIAGGQELEKSVGEKGRIAQFIGMKAGITPFISHSNLAGGDIGFLLTTDGIHDMGSNIIGGILENKESAKIAINRLLAVSEWLGGEDNATAIILSSELIQKFISNDRRRDFFSTFWTPFGRIEIALTDPSQFVEEDKSRQIGSSNRESVAPQKKRTPRKRKAKDTESGSVKIKEDRSQFSIDFIEKEKGGE